MSHWLSALLSPESIAIVGASERADSLAAISHQQLLDTGYTGQIYAVNPRYQNIRGLACYATLRDLPSVPDLVLYAISGLALEASFDEAMELKVGGIVIYASNYIENETAPKLTQRLRQKARAAGIPVCGGNSMGFYNYDDNVFISFDRPPPGRPPGHIALLLHSGSGMTYLANNDARFCFNYVIASAQETSATVADYMDYLLEQESTRVIALLLETVRDVPGFIAALKKARQKSIPVVITRIGRSDKSAQLVMSHSGAIVGNHEAFVATCQRYGAILCRDADELIVSAMLFGAGCRVNAGQLASMLDSGGMRAQMVDLAEDYDLPFAPISEATIAVLKQNLEGGLDAVNPMDGMGALGRNSAETFLNCGKALLDDDATGLLSFEFEFRDGFSHYPQLLEVTRQLAAHNHKPVILLNSCSFTSVDATACEFTWQGIPVINGIDLALRAIANLIEFDSKVLLADEMADTPLDAALLQLWRQRLQGEKFLDEVNSLALMADFGLPVVSHRLAESLEQLQQAAAETDYPLVLKTAAPGIAHKSDCNGVKVGIANTTELEMAYSDLQTRIGNRVLLMPMLGAGVEVSLGMKNDQQFGPMVVLACGGVLIELINERAFRLAPLTLADAEAMISELKLGRLLAGLRGQPPLDRAGLADLIQRFSVIVASLGDSLAEIDLNPIIVNAEGCCIVDALVVPCRSEPPVADELTTAGRVS